MSEANSVRIVIDMDHWLMVMAGLELDLPSVGIVLVPSMEMTRRAHKIKTRQQIAKPKEEGK